MVCKPGPAATTVTVTGGHRDRDGAAVTTLTEAQGLRVARRVAGGPIDDQCYTMTVVSEGCQRYSGTCLSS